MPDLSSRFGQSFGSAGSGALAGGSIGGPWGAVAGAGVGFLSGMLSKSADEQFNDFMNSIKQYVEQSNTANEAQRQSSLSTGATQIGKLTSGLKSRFSSDAARRASAAGRTTDTESYQLPIAGRVAAEGGKNLSDFEYNTNQYYDSKKLDVNQIMAQLREQKPNSPQLMDFFNSLAPAAVSFGQGQKQLQLMKSAYGLGNTPSSSLQTSGIPTTNVPAYSMPSNNWNFDFGRN